MIEDFQLPKTFRLRFELFLNTTQVFSDGWREIFTISDGRQFYDSHIIPLRLFLNDVEHQNKSGLFEIKAETWFGEVYSDTNSSQALNEHHLFNEVAIKPDHWPSSKHRHDILRSELSALISNLR